MDPAEPVPIDPTMLANHPAFDASGAHEEARCDAAGVAGSGQVARCNVASHLPRMARCVPDHSALVVTRRRTVRGRPVYETLTFLEFERLTNRYAHGLTRAGIRRGLRTLVMVRPGVEFLGLTFALFKIGAVPILIDPGMGLRRMLECIRDVVPEALIGIPQAHVVRAARRDSFGSVRCSITVGRRWLCGGPTLASLSRDAPDTFEIAPTHPDETAAILFTSGATGPAKGVVYEHAMFDAQVRLIRDFFAIEPGEVDLPAFPLFAIFNPAMGMTSVIPDMNAARPATVHPIRIVEAIRDHHVTNTFGSPAVWTRVADYCVERGIELPSLKRILIAGAPVSFRVLEQLRRVIHDDAEVHTPYGATEALPVAAVASKAVLSEHAARTRRGSGICVGRLFPEIEVRIIRITDTPIPFLSEDLVLPDGNIGEFLVRGPVVTRSYANQPSATAMAKVADGTHLWHRMGDVGYRDKNGLLWFCGRKSHRVQTPSGTLFTVPCEAVFNEHPQVARSALVGVGAPGRQMPLIIVEPKRGCFPRGARRVSFTRELLVLGSGFDLTRAVSQVLFHRGFPVDVRHNAKIDRAALADWAKERVH